MIIRETQQKAQAEKKLDSVWICSKGTHFHSSNHVSPRVAKARSPLLHSAASLARTTTGSVTSVLWLLSRAVYFQQLLRFE